MEDSILIYILIGILGNDIAQYLIKNNQRIRVPFLFMYALSFASIYTIAIIFMSIISLIHHQSIDWKNIGIFSIFTSFLLSSILFFIDKLKR